jgi:hypothetical protein
MRIILPILAIYCFSFSTASGQLIKPRKNKNDRPNVYYVDDQIIIKKHYEARNIDIFLLINDYENIDEDEALNIGDQIKIVSKADSLAFIKPFSINLCQPNNNKFEGFDKDTFYILPQGKQLFIELHHLDTFSAYYVNNSTDGSNSQEIAKKVGELLETDEKWNNRPYFGLISNKMNNGPFNHNDPISKITNQILLDEGGNSIFIEDLNLLDETLRNIKDRVKIKYRLFLPFRRMIFFESEARGWLLDQGDAHSVIEFYTEKPVGSDEIKLLTDLQTLYRKSVNFLNIREQ